MTPPTPTHGLVWDLETNGLSPEKNEAIQIAAMLVRLEPGLPLIGSFSSLMRPERPDPSGGRAEGVHGITAAELERAPRSAYVWKLFYNFTRTAPGPLLMIGHNAAFDLRFLEVAERLHGFQVARAAAPFCTCDAAKIHLKNTGAIASAKLGIVAAHYGITFRAHDALEDIGATLEIARRIQVDAPHLYAQALAGQRLSSAGSWRGRGVAHV